MSFVKQLRRRPPGEGDEPKTPPQPRTKEPEPDFPEPDDEARELVRPVETRWSFAYDA